MGSEDQARPPTADVVELSAYRSGRHSARGIPVSLSSCTTLSAGTRFALRHLFTACGQTSIFRARPLTPRSLMALSIADFCSMLQVSTDGIPLSTVGGQHLLGRRSTDYRLQMVDISSCDDFADFLRQLMVAEGLSRKDLEGLLKVSKGMIGKYMNDGSIPEDDKLQLICARYPAYELKRLRDLANGIKETQTEHAVRTEYGAKIGRIAESIQDDVLKFALMQLVTSLERDARKGTGTE